MAPLVESFDLSNTSTAYYAPATIVRADARTLNISGQIGSNKSGEVPADYESQIHLALLNLRKIIIASGATIKDITKLTIFIAKYDPTRRKHTRHLQRFFRGHRPAMSLVPVPQLAFPEWLVEIEATVAISAQSTSIPRALSTAAASPKSVDVAIIGAGLAGLSAAQEVVRAGLTCVILEARDRVGGKTWSQPLADGKGVIELGAGWLNDENQTKMIGLVRRFGLELIEQNTTGNVAFEDLDGSISSFAYGDLPKFDRATVEDVARIRDMVEVDCQALDVFQPRDSQLDSMTFEAYLRSRGASEAAVWTATVWTRAMLGVNPSDISALFFLNYCKSGGGIYVMRSDRKGGGQHLRLRQGTQSISKALAAALPEGTVSLNSPVQDVVQNSAETIDVFTRNGMQFRARKVITTVPSPVLKNINFVPRLSPAKLVWSEAASYGYYTKAMAVFTNPFWIRKGFCGLTQSFTGPIAVIRDSCSPADKKYVLTCFMAGPPAQEWAALPAAEREDKLLNQIGKLYGAEDTVRKDFVELHMYEWVNDEWSGYGCPCASLPPGVLDALGPDALRQPLGNLHFAGTETSGEWKGYMEGAVRSGERAAAEVIGGLRMALASRL